MSMILAACGIGDSPDPTPRPPTAIPPTSTPRSTPLPEAPLPPEVGSDERPIALYFVLPDDTPRSQARLLAEDVSVALKDEGVSSTIEFVNNETEAFEALCNHTERGNPAAAWVGPFTWVSAREACNAIPVLALAKGTGTNATIGSSSEILAQPEIDAIEGLADTEFCRISALDDTSWIIPALLMSSEGVDPFTDLAAVADYPDSLALLEALYNGECDAAAFPPDELEDLQEALIERLDRGGTNLSQRELANALPVLSPAGDTSLPSDLKGWEGYDDTVIPYRLLAFPADVVIPANQRDAIRSALLDFFNDRVDGPGRTRAMLDGSEVFRAGPDQLDAFAQRVQRAKWDPVFTD